MDIIRIFPSEAACMQRVNQLRRGDTDHLDNLQLLCGARHSVKSDRTQEHLLVRLQGRAA